MDVSSKAGWGQEERAKTGIVGDFKARPLYYLYLDKDQVEETVSFDGCFVANRLEGPRRTKTGIAKAFKTKPLRPFRNRTACFALFGKRGKLREQVLSLLDGFLIANGLAGPKKNKTGIVGDSRPEPMRNGLFCLYLDRPFGGNTS